jgi:hypothetical protein
LHQDVVPAKREPALVLQLGVEDVDQRERALEEDAPGRELLVRWA